MLLISLSSIEATLDEGRDKTGNTGFIVAKKRSTASDFERKAEKINHGISKKSKKF